MATITISEMMELSEKLYKKYEDYWDKMNYNLNRDYTKSKTKADKSKELLETRY